MKRVASYQKIKNKKIAVGHNTDSKQTIFFFFNKNKIPTIVQHKKHAHFIASMLHGTLKLVLYLIKLSLINDIIIFLNRIKPLMPSCTLETVGTMARSPGICYYPHPVHLIFIWCVWSPRPRSQLESLAFSTTIAIVRSWRGCSARQSYRKVMRAKK